MNGETHIVSLIVHVSPEHKAAVMAKANQLPRAECHSDDEAHKFVLVFEAESEAMLNRWFDEINSWEGVMSAQLCYHHCESYESLQEEIQYANHAS